MEPDPLDPLVPGYNISSPVPDEETGPDPVGWWEVIGGAWRWVLYPNPD
ncbi:MAG TPA: hypothetical protein VF006_19475 [Longimicrobium sp.]